MLAPATKITAKLTPVTNNMCKAVSIVLITLATVSANITFLCNFCICKS